MKRNTYLSRSLLKQHQARRKAQMMSNIEKRILLQTKSANRLRYVGLFLVQGSSALILLGFSMTPYWTMLWFGLLCYSVSSVFFYKEDNRVYRMTKKKLDLRLGSSQQTVDALAEKRTRERVYIIGNTIGLILVAYNLIISIS